MDGLLQRFMVSSTAQSISLYPTIVDCHFSDYWLYRIQLYSEIRTKSRLGGINQRSCPSIRDSNIFIDGLGRTH
ncbi:hypothetical protein D3C86_1380270 [compost metagenome]